MAKKQTTLEKVKEGKNVPLTSDLIKSNAEKMSAVMTLSETLQKRFVPFQKKVKHVNDYVIHAKKLKWGAIAGWKSDSLKIAKGIFTVLESFKDAPGNQTTEEINQLKFAMKRDAPLVEGLSVLRRICADLAVKIRKKEYESILAYFNSQKQNIIWLLQRSADSNKPEKPIISEIESLASEIQFIDNTTMIDVSKFLKSYKLKGDNTSAFDQYLQMIKEKLTTYATNTKQNIEEPQKILLQLQTISKLRKMLLTWQTHVKQKGSNKATLTPNACLQVLQSLLSQCKEKNLKKLHERIAHPEYQTMLAHNSLVRDILGDDKTRGDVKNKSTFINIDGNQQPSQGLYQSNGKTYPSMSQVVHTALESKEWKTNLLAFKKSDRLKLDLKPIDPWAYKQISEVVNKDAPTIWDEKIKYVLSKRKPEQVAGTVYAVMFRALEEEVKESMHELLKKKELLQKTIDNLKTDQTKVIDKHFRELYKHFKTLVDARNKVLIERMKQNFDTAKPIIDARVKEIQEMSETIFTARHQLLGAKVEIEKGIDNTLELDPSPVIPTLKENIERAGTSLKNAMEHFTWMDKVTTDEKTFLSNMHNATAVFTKGMFFTNKIENSVEVIQDIEDQFTQVETNDVSIKELTSMSKALDTAHNKMSEIITLMEKVIGQDVLREPQNKLEEKPEKNPPQYTTLNSRAA